MIKCLIHPVTYATVAELAPEKEVTILDKNMLESLTMNGITVSSEFKEANRVGWKVYPKDDKKVFAKAFEQFYFIHGLQQQGYTWENKNDSEAPLTEKMKDILSNY
ncbi:hypothetical protein PNK_2356 [Candidatus Protochlamydia naegleriophila]|uniref:Uncharacterized protein n=1 Tax=Candidatus Protochlamydia naegleriophila TaxID=389348 RepID=A0A0U5EUV8_9BACT|nr:hypothetical protein [Candidatus Protochlamydia naegleriophila]CUI17953.1 hypothetical protein PNK_2356 [Candidatus Protochlamydia naegleriophila]